MQLDSSGEEVCMGCATTNLESHRRASGVAVTAKGLIIVGIGMGIFAAKNLGSDGDPAVQVLVWGLIIVSVLMVLIGFGLQFSWLTPRNESSADTVNSALAEVLLPSWLKRK